jgi:outer membrane lipoprotein-sorting protein
MLLMAVLETSACSILGPAQIGQPETPIAGFAAGQHQVQELIAALAERDKRLDSMQTPLVMEYTAGDQHVKAKEDIVVKRPGNLRVDAMSPFGVALVLAAQGSDLSIFEPGRSRFMRGHATADTLYRYARIPMAPADAVALLMGLAPPQFALDRVADSVSRDGAMTVASYGNAASGTRELGFSAGNLVMVRETAGNGGGGVDYEVRYSDYRDIGGVMFPYVVDATFPAAGSHVTFRYLRPIVNGEIPASTFVLTPAPGATLMNLSLDDARAFSNEC